MVDDAKIFCCNAQIKLLRAMERITTAMNPCTSTMQVELLHLREAEQHVKDAIEILHDAQGTI